MVKVFVALAFSLACLAVPRASVSAASVPEGACASTATRILSSLGVVGPYNVDHVPGQAGGIAEVTGSASNTKFGFDFTGKCKVSAIKITPTSSALRLRQPVPGIEAVAVRKTKAGYDVVAYGRGRSVQQSFAGGITIVIDANANVEHLVISSTVAGGLGSGLIHPFTILGCSGTPRFSPLHLPGEGTRVAPGWPTC